MRILKTKNKTNTKIKMVFSTGKIRTINDKEYNELKEEILKEEKKLGVTYG